jgi:hypothetical protein
VNRAASGWAVASAVPRRLRIFCNSSSVKVIEFPASLISSRLLPAAGDNFCADSADKSPQEEIPMSFTPSALDPALDGLTLEVLCASLTRALQEFLQAHTATIEAYVAHCEEADGPRSDAAHRTLTQEVEHVEHFVDTLQADIVVSLKGLQRFDKKRPLSH